MATQMQAIAAYRPKIKHGKKAEIEYVAELISTRTAQNEGAVLQMLTELRDVVASLMRKGQAVKLPGLGTFSTSISLGGKIKVTTRIDKFIKSELNKDARGFSGDIVNRDYIGKTVDDLIAQWNLDHPDDPVVEG